MFLRWGSFYLWFLLGLHTADAVAASTKSIPLTAFQKRTEALLQRFTNEKKFGHHSVMIQVEDQPLYQWQSEKQVKPASTLKTLTSLLSFDVLGENFRFQTGLTVQNMGDRIRVYVKGQGDPSWSMFFLTPAGFKDHASPFFEHLKQRIMQVQTTPALPVEFVLDDASFVGTSNGPWKNENLARCYSAGVGAFNFDFNCDSVVMVPPKKVTEAPVIFQKWAPGYFAFKDLTQWRKKSRRGIDALDVALWDRTRDAFLAEWDQTDPSEEVSWSELVNFYRLEGSREVVFEGDGLPVGGAAGSFRVSVDNSTDYFAKLLRRKLEESGLVVTGWERGEFIQNEMTEFVSATDMSDLIYMLNKESLNLIAEGLFRALSLMLRGQSSYDASRELARQILSEKLGVPTSDFYFADGSGLSHDNRVSTRLLVQAFRYSMSRNWALTFEKSLPVAGVSGTLAGRMRSGCYLEDRYYSDNKACGLRGNVQAKTGSIDGVIALVGMMRNYQGKRVFFAFSSQDFEDLYSHRVRLRTALHEQILAELYRTQW